MLTGDELPMLKVIEPPLLPVSVASGPFKIETILPGGASISKSYSNQQSLALDSSIWLLEATINSDFDEQSNYDEETFNDSLIYNVELNKNGTDRINDGFLTDLELNDVSDWSVPGRVLNLLDDVMLYTGFAPTPRKSTSNRKLCD